VHSVGLSLQAVWVTHVSMSLYSYVNHSIKASGFVTVQGSDVPIH